MRGADLFVSKLALRCHTFQRHKGQKQGYPVCPVVSPKVRGARDVFCEVATKTRFKAVIHPKYRIPPFSFIGFLSSNSYRPPIQGG